MENTLGPGDHGSTYGGNPVACAGAEYVLSRIDETFLGHVRDMGEYLRSRLMSMPGVAEVSGKGLMIGAELKHKGSLQVIRECLDNGLLLLKAQEKIRMLPPLMITKHELDEGLAILEKAL